MYASTEKITMERMTCYIFSIVLFYWYHNIEKGVNYFITDKFIVPELSTWTPTLLHPHFPIVFVFC